VLGHEEERFLGGLAGVLDAALAGGEERLEAPERA
jgi:hypothetical protein